ncbi:unnamed protein product [Calypogeia fissa]
MAMKILSSPGDNLVSESSCSELGREQRRQDRFVPTFTSEQIAFYKSAIARLKEKIGSTHKEFLALSQQFSAQPNMHAAQLRRNSWKIRYVNVLPFDENRVKLLPINGSLNPGNYINASFILDPLHQNLPGFHCSSGTSQFTVTDFWQMAVQQRENQSQVFGHFQVTKKALRLLRDGRILQRHLKAQPISNSDAAPSHIDTSGVP